MLTAVACWAAFWTAAIKAALVVHFLQLALQRALDLTTLQFSMPSHPCAPCLASVVATCPTYTLQVAGLTRLHALHLSANTFPSDRFGSLAALGSTLQSLCLENNDSLPDCLPQMLALRTLVSWHWCAGDV